MKNFNAIPHNPPRHRPKPKYIEFWPIFEPYNVKQDAVLSQGGPRDAAANFDTYQILQRHRTFSLLNAFLVGL